MDNKFGSVAGALYLDFTAGYDKLEDAVPPGAEITYTWYIEKKHAPLPDDDNCVAWAYHSHTLAPRDIHTGLLGILLICKPGR